MRLLFLLLIPATLLWVVGGDLIKIKPGLIFDKIKPLTFSSKTHTLVLDYDLSVVFNNLRTVKSHLGEAELITNRKRTPLNAFYLKELSEISKVVRNTESFLKDFLSAHADKRRHKRSSSSPLHFLLYSVLGVITEDEIKELEKAISSSMTSERKFINKLVSHITISDKYVHRLANAVHKSGAALKAIASKLENLDERLSNVSLDLAMSISISYFAFASNELSAEVDRAVSAIQSSLISNVVSTLFLRPQVLLEFLTELQKQDIQLLWPVSEKELANYFSAMSVKVIIFGTHVYFCLDIPIRDTTNNFMLYKILPFWSPVGMPNWARRVITDHTFLAVSRDEKSFLLFRDTDGCRDTSDLLVCSKGYPVLSSDAPQCIISNFLDRDSESAKRCRYEINTDFSHSFMNLNKIWLVSATAPLSLKTVCPTGVVEHVAGPGIIQLAMNNSCEVHGNTFRLPNQQKLGEMRL